MIEEENKNIINKYNKTFIKKEKENIYLRN
jgi:hypothetical protein